MRSGGPAQNPPRSVRPPGTRHDDRWDRSGPHPPVAVGIGSCLPGVKSTVVGTSLGAASPLAENGGLDPRNGLPHRLVRQAVDALPDRAPACSTPRASPPSSRPAARPSTQASRADSNSGTVRFLSGSLTRYGGGILLDPVAVMATSGVTVPDVAPGDGSAALAGTVRRQGDPLADPLDAAPARPCRRRPSRAGPPHPCGPRAPGGGSHPAGANRLGNGGRPAPRPRGRAAGHRRSRWRRLLGGRTDPPPGQRGTPPDGRRALTARRRAAETRVPAPTDARRPGRLAQPSRCRRPPGPEPGAGRPAGGSGRLDALTCCRYGVPRCRAAGYGSTGGGSRRPTAPRRGAR